MKGGWVRLPLCVSQCLSLLCSASRLGSPLQGPGGVLVWAGPPFGLSALGLGWRAAKDGTGAAGCHLVPWSISPIALAKGPLAPIKLLPASGAPPHSSIPRRLEVAGGGRRAQKVPGRSYDGLHCPSTHTRGDSCSISPIRLQSPRRNRPAPLSPSRACMSSQPATLSCTWRKVGRRASMCMSAWAGLRPWGQADLPRGRGCCSHCSARGLGGHCMGGVHPGYHSSSPADTRV